MHSPRSRPAYFVIAPLVAFTLAGCGTLFPSRSPSDLALAEENYKLKASQEKLRQQLAEAKGHEAPASSAGDLRGKLEQSDEKLSHALRSYSQAQEETARLQAEVDRLRSENSALVNQVKELTAKVAALPASAAPAPVAAAAPAAAAATPNADTEANLATALRSYALVSSENDQLKAQREKLAGEKAALESQISALRGAMPLAAQAEGLREQLRQTQAQSAAFAEENARLKTQLSGTGASNAPSRSNAVTPVDVTTTPDAAPTPTPALAKPEARVHTVAAGDSLSKISLKYYGTASRWPEILAANRDTLKNENSLIAGRTLRIP